MPQPVKWLYYLLDEDGKSFNYENDLVINNVPVPLENTPDGWQEKVVNFGRNTKYFGLFRSFTIPLRFVTEGKKVLRHLLYNFGIEKICSLSIKKLNNAWTYDNYYTGEIDFSKFSDEKDFCTVNIMEGGLSKLLKAKEATPYEIPVYGANALAILMEGINLRSTITYAFVEGGINNILFTLGIQFAYQEGTSIGIVMGNSPLQDASGFDSATNDDRWVLNSNESTVLFNWKQNISFSVTALSFIRIYFEKNTGAQTDIIPGQNFTTGIHSIDVDINISLAPGEKLFVLASHGGTDTISFGGSNFNVTFLSKALPSFIPALTLKRVLDQLVNKITGGNYEAESTLLDSRTDLLLASGDAVRGLVGAVIKTHLNDYHKSLYSILNIGLGIQNDKIKVENLLYFFDNTTEIADLGEVSNFKLTIAEDLQYSSIKAGYADQKYDDVNGRDEFNSTQIYQSPLTKPVPKEWDLTSPYRADAFGMEFVRANLTQKKTTDSSSDNDVFIIQIVPFSEVVDSIHVIFSAGTTFKLIGVSVLDKLASNVKITFTGTTSNNATFTIVTAVINGNDIDVITVESATAEDAATATYTLSYYKPKKGPYDTTPTGLISPDSVFNIELSPKRNLLRHENYINSMYYKMDTQEVTFQSALKNAELVASVGGISVSEKANVTIGTTPKLFLPFYFTFDCQVPIDLVDLMATNSRGFFSFTWLGNSYTGFPIDISIKPADNDIQEFKLLACPDNDLTKLI